MERGIATTGKERGFRFFFWVSASLFILAGANWLFDKYIEIAGLGVPYLIGVVVMLVSIFLVAELLMIAYHGVSEIREILDGLLGLKRDHMEKTTVSTVEEESKEASTTEDDVLDKIAHDTPVPLSDAISSVLSLYGSEVTSHASIAVGFFVALFALVQVRTSVTPFVFFAALSVVFFGAIYAGFRLIYWATLSTALMHGYLSRMQQFAASELQKQMKRIPHAFVNEYARAYLINDPKIHGDRELKIRRFIYKRARVPFVISIALALAVAFILVVALQPELVTWFGFLFR